MQPSHRARRGHTWFADWGPDPSGTVTELSRGNFRNTGTNVKVKGAPIESWRKEKWPVSCPHNTHNNPELIDTDTCQSSFPGRATFHTKTFFLNITQIG